MTQSVGFVLQNQFQLDELDEARLDELVWLDPLGKESRRQP